MSDDYGKTTDITEDMAEALLPKLRKLVERYKPGDDLLQDAQDLLSEVATDFDESGIYSPIVDELDEVFSPSKTPYAVGPTFADLNHPDYRVLVDNMVVIGAEANTGKTSLMTALAADLLAHNPNMCALIYSLDDGGTMTKKRIVSQLVGDSLLKTHSVPRSRLSERDSDILRRLYVRDSIRLHDIEREAGKVKAATGCSAIYIGIDYLQIVPVSGDRTGKREGYNEAVKQLKELHKKLAPSGCILVVLSQLNRLGKDDRRDSMNRFRETSEVENQADAALLMFPMESETENDRRIEAKLVKNKKGMRGRWWKSELTEGHRFATFVSFVPDRKHKQKIDTEALERNAGKKAERLKKYEGAL